MVTFSLFLDWLLKTDLTVFLFVGISACESNQFFVAVLLLLPYKDLGKISVQKGKSVTYITNTSKRS